MCQVLCRMLWNRILTIKPSLSALSRNVCYLPRERQARKQLQHNGTSALSNVNARPVENEVLNTFRERENALQERWHCLCKPMLTSCFVRQTKGISLCRDHRKKWRGIPGDSKVARFKTQSQFSLHHCVLGSPSLLSSIP